MKILFILMILASVSSKAFGLPESKISIRHGHSRFEAIKTKKQIRFERAQGTSSLEIKNCNRPLVTKFWNELRKDAESAIAFKSKKRPLRGTASVIIDGKEKLLLPFHRGYDRLFRSSQRADLLIVASELECQRSRKAK